MDSCSAGFRQFREQDGILCTNDKARECEYEEGTLCVEECGFNYPYVNGKKCVSKCPEYVENNVCVTKCASYVLNASDSQGKPKICVQACQFKDETGLCYDSCPEKLKYQRAVSGYVLCTNNSAGYVILSGTYLLDACPVGYEAQNTSVGTECKMQTCYNGQYHQRVYDLTSCSKDGECTKYTDECVDYCTGGVFKQLEDSDQTACVDTCEEASVEVRVQDQIYKKCANLRCRFTEKPLTDLVTGKCVEKCAPDEYLLEETLTCQSVCPFHAYKKVGDQRVCVQSAGQQYEKVDGYGADSYVSYILNCPELYDAAAEKCVSREECAGRVLDDACVAKCPRTHYRLGSECVLACPEKQFAVVEGENVCAECARFKLQRDPRDSVVQCVDACPVGYGIDSETKQCRSDCRLVRQGMCINETICKGSDVVSASGCVSACPEGMFSDGGVCVFECPRYF